MHTAQPRQGIWRTYDATDGLPGAVLCLLLGRQGYLWLGTQAGLCRYDGHQFVTYATADGLPANAIQAMCEDERGRLWVGTGAYNVHGSGVACFDGRRFTSYTTSDGLAHNHVSAIHCDRDGRLWFATSGGISCLSQGHFTNYIAEDSGPHHASAICEDQQGRLWFGTWERNRTHGRGVICYDGKRFVTLEHDDGVVGNNVSVVYVDRKAQVWLGAAGSDGGISIYESDAFLNMTTAQGLVSNWVTSIHEDTQGRIWVGTVEGVTCIEEPNQFVDFCRAASSASPELGFPSEQREQALKRPRLTHYGRDDELSSLSVWDIAEDREGGLWFAVPDSGLTRFEPDRLRLLTREPVTQTLVQDRAGKLWFCSGTTLFRLDGDTQRIRDSDNGFHLAQDTRGHFWTSVPGDGLCHYPTEEALLAGKGVRFHGEGLAPWTGVLLGTHDGCFWVATWGGPLYCFDLENFLAGRALQELHVPYRLVTQLLGDSRGRLWMGSSYGGGLSCYDKGELRTYRVQDGLPSDHVLSIVEDNQEGLWVGTLGGLCRLDGQQFVLHGQDQDAVNHSHSCSAIDAQGQLWFGTQLGGIYRYNGTHFQQLTTKDGLPSNTVGALVPQSDGSMVIGTHGGIVRYWPTLTTSPDIDIREVIADRVYQAPNQLELPTTAADVIIISYQGLSFATRRMRYSFILEGHDSHWHETWDNRVRYEGLPVGEYTFKVRAIHRDLLSSETPAQLALKILPDPRDQQIEALQSDVTRKNQQLVLLEREVRRKYQFDSILGNSLPIQRLHVLMARAIESDLTVLITGETGTGKELVAKAIHYNSSRGTAPLREINCGAVSRELVASTLFGHARGAFTGAHEARAGLFEEASGGTLLLDEIGEMPEGSQIHLLRVLQQRSVQRVGETRLREVDVRIIAITNRDLEAEVMAGRFREDLYYRLSVFPITVPPLRERVEDIPLLVEHFFQSACQYQDRELNGIAPGVIEMLQTYAWPGNIRELEHAIHRAVALSDEGFSLQQRHFSPRITRTESLVQDVVSKGEGYRALVDRFRRRIIEEALTENQWNRSATARQLGMDPSNLRQVMKRLGIQSPSGRE